MNILLACILLPAGFALLMKGADFLIDGAVALSQRFGVSPLIIGLTVVAMGTSAPEVAASITAALSGKGDMAIGNVFGSNIANLALVGGACAMLRPLQVRLSTLKRELPLMLIVALLLWPFLHNLRLERTESLFMLAVFIAVITLTIYFGIKDSRKESAAVKLLEEEVKEKTTSIPQTIPWSLLLIILGLGGLTIGARLTIESASFIGEAIGLSQAVIGSTIIAIGTSLPELMTGLIAAKKGHDDISLGNIVGSNVFNTMLVIGAAGIIRPFDISARFAGPDYWIMIAVSIIFLVIAGIYKKIGKKSGLLLVCIYIGYLVYLLAISDPTA